MAQIKFAPELELAILRDGKAAEAFLRTSEPQRITDFLDRFNGFPLRGDVLERWGRIKVWVERFQAEPDQELLIKLAELLTELAALQNSPPKTSLMSTGTLFVSYRSKDRALALRVAHEAIAAGKNVFLDIWDPSLATIHGSALPKPVKSLLTAIIIEIALLHATHLVVVHTSRTASSVWVPYEIGRAKQRTIRSNDVAFWHSPLKPPPARQLPGYAHLVHQVIRDPAPNTMNNIRSWISTI